MSLENPAYSSATISAYSDVWCNVFFLTACYLKIGIALEKIENNANLSKSIWVHQSGESFIQNFITSFFFWLLFLFLCFSFQDGNYCLLNVKYHSIYQMKLLEMLNNYYFTLQMVMNTV